MSLSDGSGLSASDVLALTANNNDGFGGNGFGGGWWLILFILMMFGGFGWGNNANNGAGNLAGMAVPYMMGQNSEVQRGFDQSATMTALNNLSMTTGRYVSRGYDNHYSGHSIHDRMIAKLEELYNEGIGPHDEAVVAAGIRMIEQNR